MRNSTNWWREFQDSVWWIIQIYPVVAVLSVVVVALVVTKTEWGKRLARVCGGYVTSRGTRKTSVVFIGLMVLVVVINVRVSVVFTYQFRDLVNAVQEGAAAVAVHDRERVEQARHVFWVSFCASGVLALLTVIMAVSELYLGRVYALKWRIWLNDRGVENWLTGEAYYRARFIKNAVDNPDQRIHEDVDAITTKTTFLGLGVLKAILATVSFTFVLATLSSHFSVGGIEIPSMVLLAFIYAGVVSVVAFKIGFPLVRMNVVSELLGGRYRYSLIRLRESAEQVAFFRGEHFEREKLRHQFARIVRNAQIIRILEVRLMGWNTAIGGITTSMLVFLLQGPRVFSGNIGAGELLQTQAAFGQVSTSLEYFRTNYEEFAQLSAALERLGELLDHNDVARLQSKIETEHSSEGLVVEGLTVQEPAGREIVSNLQVRFEPGDTVLIVGPSGCGKTTLLRALAGMWPYVKGRSVHPQDSLFLPQIPYIPHGEVGEVLAYPRTGSVSDSDCHEVLSLVGLEYLWDRDASADNWLTRLSPGEQQRLSIARALLARPLFLIMDEATSALDEETEALIYERVHTHLPDTVILSVAHRSTVQRWHKRVLRLSRDGTWRISAANE